MEIENTTTFFDESVKEPAETKAARRTKRKQEKETRTLARTPKPIVARTRNQEKYIAALKSSELVFAEGPAGSGKTYVPSRVFARMLLDEVIEKIYVARPNVAKNKHRNGFLPGGIEEKSAPWLVPIFEAMKEELGVSRFDFYRKSGQIEEVPFEYIQGRTLKNAAFIVDEAENLDLDDFYITLTRQGDNLRAAICGDIIQSRIPDSGLRAVIEMVEKYDMESVTVISFTENDVVRSRQAAQWVKAFKRHTQEIKQGFGDSPPNFMRD